MLENIENQIPQEHRQVLEKEEKREHGERQVHAPLRPSPSNEEKRDVKRLGKYEFSMDQKLGSGMSGDAYLGINTQTQELVCVKVIDRAVYKTPEQRLLLQNQIRCQTACNSTFTIRILDVFDTASFCFIVTEFCEGGDLYRLLKGSAHGLPEPLVAFFGQQIASAMGKLQQAKIVHRDIKSENILLQRGQCKLGDFGFAVQEIKLSHHEFNLGSPLYMSLQALEKSQYSFASDIFAFGVVLYEMIHKQSPWQCSEESELIFKMKNQKPEIKSDISQPMKDLIMGCLKMAPAERPTIEQILTHQALKGLPVLQ